MLAVFVATWAAAPATAELCNPCVASIAPGTSVAAITLDGWLLPEDTVAATVVEPPAYGAWDHGAQTYRPGPDFWRVGGDSVTIRVRTRSRRHEGLKSLLLAPARETLFVQEGFGGELSQSTGSPLPPSWIVSGDAPGALSMTSEEDSQGDSWVHIHVDGGDSAYLESAPVGTQRSGDPNAVAGILEIAVSEPPISAGDAFGATVLDLDGLVKIELGQDPGSHIYEVRAAFFDQHFDCGSTCGTPWVDLAAPVPHRLTLRAGQVVLGPPEEDVWNLTFLIEEVHPDGTTTAIEAMEISSPKRPTGESGSPGAGGLTRAGLITHPGSTGGGALQLRWLRRTSSYLSEDGETAFAGFDPQPPTPFIPTFLDLKAEGPVSVGFDARDDGHGLAHLEEAMPPALGAAEGPGSDTGQRLTWTSLAPDDASEVSVLMTVDAGRAALPPGTTLGLLELGLTDSTGEAAGRVVMKTDRRGRRFVAMEAPDVDARDVDWIRTSQALPVPTGPFRLGWTWRRGDGTESGIADLWAEGATASLTHLENSTFGVERVTFGVTDLRLGDPHRGVRGPIRFDDFFLRHE